MKLRALLTMLSISVALQSYSQSSGQIRGTIMDNNGVVKTGATVVLLDTKGQVVTSISTDQKGVFVFKELNEDAKYKIKVSMIGYESYLEDLKGIKSGDSNSILITLKEQLQPLMKW